MATADLGEELRCSICLNIYTEPVSLRCGHNYCQGCIGRVLETQEGSGVYSCPECREEFLERPALEKNRKLGNIVESFLCSQTPREETEILCTYCDSDVPATKSCLHCEASFCAKHLGKHSRSPEHVLCDPTDSFQERKCSGHQELLRYYCAKDSATICVSCWVAGDHRSHHVELLNVASETKKEELRNAISSLRSKREEAESRVQRLQDHCKAERDRAADVNERVNEMFQDIRDQLDSLEERVQDEIARQEEQTAAYVSRLISQLQTHKDEMTRKIERMEELCHISDPLTLLKKEAESDVTSPCDVIGDVSNAGGVDEGVISQMLQWGLKHFSNFVIGLNVKSRLVALQKSNILLDVNTACNSISLSQDLRSAYYSPPVYDSYYGRTNPNRAATPERFTCLQVLSTGSFSTGRHYWEVDVSKAQEWLTGVAAHSIQRDAGDKSYIGHNDKSWSVQYRKRLAAMHNDISSRIKGAPVQNVGIYLDYEAGRLTFYQLSDPVRHLYTFTATFSEPLHAAISVLTNTTVTFTP